MEKNEGSENFIAVIGLSGKFPSAKDIAEFWENLINKQDSIRFFSDEELIESGIDPKLFNRPNYIRARGVLKDANCFDSSFFGYTPREAELLDPQQRVFLECAWHALEDGGYDPNDVKGRVGVYGGSGTPWQLIQVYKNPRHQKHVSGVSIVTSTEKDYLTSRISYKLNLTGPSVTVQSACSTSLLAVYLGMQSLLEYQNDMVIAGGVSINVPEKHGYLYEAGSIDSPDGKCRPFDAKAEGTVFSSGSGVVLLKRLSEAIEDKDNIYCIIRGGAINNDGFSKVSYTAPSIEGQIQVEIEALEMSQTHPESISYVEAHGTGTPIGDPIEISALTQAFGKYTKKKQYCAISTAKSNIGHTDTASGVIGLIKTALSLKHSIIPPLLHFEAPNENIDFENSPFYVPTEPLPWERCKELPRRALINSFGIGGTNVSLVLEEAPLIESNSFSKDQNLLVLSAKSPERLEVATENISNFIYENRDIDLDDACYTLQVGRRRFYNRRFVSFSDRDELLFNLENKIPGKFFDLPNQDDTEKSVVFMFPGQGNQYSGMGKDLYEKSPVFKKQVDYCCDFLSDSMKLEKDFRNILFDSVEKNVDLLKKTVFAQTALFIIEYATANLLMEWGAAPKTLIGHSVGEFVAATLSGIFSLEDALEITYTRGKLTQDLPAGSMLAIFLDQESVAKLIPPPLEISVVNSPNLTVISGPTPNIELFERKLQEKNIQAKRLYTSHAFHSHMIEPIVTPLKEFIASKNLHSMKTPIISTVTGSLLSDEMAKDPSYWANHGRKPVLFSKAISQLLSDQNHIYVEVGPGHSLESSLKNHLNPPSQHPVVSTLPSHSEPKNSYEQLHISLGKLWAYGGYSDWNRFYENKKRRRISLPGYPFEREKYALDLKSNLTAPEEKTKKIDDVAQWFYFPTWVKDPSFQDSYEKFFQDQEFIWIVFANNDELSKSVLNYLNESNQKTISVYQSEKFETEENETFFLSPNDKESYENLLSFLSKYNSREIHILHLWNTKDIPLDIPIIDKSIERTFFTLLHLIQALIKNNLIEGLHLSCFTKDVFSVSGKEEINPLAATVTGPVRVFGNEYPTAKSRMIDIELPKNRDQIQYLATLLVHESLNETNDIVTAIRDFERWIPIYHKKRIEEASNPLRTLKENGTYLITGGTGGLALSLAYHIAETISSPTFILLHKSPLPPKSDWIDWIDSKTCDPVLKKKLENLSSIQALGATIKLHQCDLANKKETIRVFNEINIENNQINGVLHCAGVPGKGVIPLKEDQIAKSVIDPKIKGTLLLAENLKDRPLDFFILFSSVTAIFGEAGQVDYCSANAFLDSYALKYKKQLKGLQSINWGKWDIVGMAVHAQNNTSNELKEKDVSPTENEWDRLNPISIDEKQHCFRLDIDPQRDWFIKNHRLSSYPTLVGTTYFHFLYEWAKKFQSSKQFKISELNFISPIMFTGKEEKNAYLELIQKNDSWKFTFSSGKSEILTTQDESQDHSIGTINCGELDKPKPLNIPSIIQRLKQDKAAQTQLEIGEHNGKPLLSLGPRWNTDRQVFVREKEWIACLKHPAKYLSDFDFYEIHPALLDIASTFALSYVSEELYLPLGYDTLSFYSPLESEIYSYIQLTERSDEKETVSIDITITDLKGNILLKVDGYKLKEIASSDSRTSNLDQTNKQKFTDAILPSEGVEAFKRAFSQIKSEQFIICPKDFEQMIIDNTPSIQEEIGEETSIGLYPRPHLMTPYILPTNEIESSIANIWQTVLGIEQIGIHDNFIELGGNSLMAVQIVSQITGLFKIDLKVESFLENPTVSHIADRAIAKLLDDIEEEKLEDLLNAVESHEEK